MQRGDGVGAGEPVVKDADHRLFEREPGVPVRHFEEKLRALEVVGIG